MEKQEPTVHKCAGDKEGQRKTDQTPKKIDLSDKLDKQGRQINEEEKKSAV